MLRAICLLAVLAIACTRDPAPPQTPPGSAAPQQTDGSRPSPEPPAVPQPDGGPSVPKPEQILSIDSLTPGNPLKVSGHARTFENNVVLRVREGDALLVETYTTANGEIGHWNPWTAEIWLTRMPRGGRLTVDAIEHSAKDGSVRAIVSRDADLGARSAALELTFPLGDCTRFRSFRRDVPHTVSVARVAVEALVAGPTAHEKAAGASNPFPRGAQVRSVILRNGTVTVDFDERLQNVGGACAATAIRESVTRTLRALPSVQRVVITAGGSEKLALQP